MAEQVRVTSELTISFPALLDHPKETKSHQRNTMKFNRNLVNFLRNPSSSNPADISHSSPQINIYYHSLHQYLSPISFRPGILNDFILRFKIRQSYTSKDVMRRESNFACCDQNATRCIDIALEGGSA